MRKWILILTCSFCVICLAFTPPSVLFHTPEGWPEPVYDFKKNPLKKETIELGRVLFYDPILSRDSTISCASCHLQYTAFTHVDHSLSHGIDGKTGTRNSPALTNLAWSRLFMWDGAVNHLDVQMLAPISNPVEMDENIKHVTEKLSATSVYPQRFRAAFGDTAITGARVLKAMSQFLVTLVSANSKYDQVMRKEDTFNVYEANGYKLFKENCSSCHTEPLFTNNKFENNGLLPDTALNDYGRMAVTHNPADSLLFKVPTLRNIQYSAPYMHDGRFKNLSQVINYYMMGIQNTPTLSPQLKKGIYFTAREKAELIAFLYTLTDKEFLKDPRFGYPLNK